MVSQSTSQQVAAVLGSSAWSAVPHTLGVRNPDGTAAQMALGDESDGHNRYGPPQPNDNSVNDTAETPYVLKATGPISALFC